MARTKETANAGMNFVPTAEGGVVMNICDLVETRIQGVKIMLPVRLKGTESGEERATNFYTTVGRLDAVKREVTVAGRITHLANNCNLANLAEMNLFRLDKEYIDQMFDPSKWEVITFHTSDGAVNRGTVTTADHQILKGAGSATTNTNNANRRVADIKFVKVKLTVDFSKLTKDEDNKYDLITII